MKQYRILVSFDGSQTGHDFIRFHEGATESLSDSLAASAVAEGWAEEVKPKEERPAEQRETKIVAPEETKPNRSKFNKKSD